MSCWVAPTLAAEIWQISLELLMSRIASGEIPVREEDGFIFVDVAPYGPRVERPNRAPHERPATFTAVDGDSALMITEAEAAALSMPPTPPTPPVPTRADDDDDDDDDDEMGPEDETASQTLGDWRTIRRKTARTRVPPPKPRRLSA
jgi:hypothetical protein